MQTDCLPLHPFALELLQALELLGIEKLVDAAEVLAHTLVTKLVDLGDEAVEEVAVVTHDDEGAVIVLQGLLKHVLGLEVEVVGGLVEYEQVHRLKQKFKQRKACVVTTREHI